MHDGSRREQPNTQRIDGNFYLKNKEILYELVDTAVNTE